MSTDYEPRPLRITLTALFMLVLGALMSIGGAYLALLGGSWYYLVAGVGLLVAAALVFARRRAAIWLYAVLLLGTLLWTLYEVRFDWWQLAPRIDLWCLLGLWLILPFVNRHIGARLAWRDGASGLLGLGLVAGALMAGYSLTQDYHSLKGAFSDAQMEGLDPEGQAGRLASEWTAYGGSSRGDRYSPADLITPENVGRLEKAWEYHTGDLPREGDPGELTNQVTPLKVGDKLLICTPHSIAIALDADTGEERWRFDPAINADAEYYQHMTCRGMAFHDATAYGAAATRLAQPDAPVARCERRLFLPTNDGTLVALDVEDGKPCEDFGEAGVVDLKKGLGEGALGVYLPTSPPVVTEKLVIVGGSITDNGAVDSPGGVIRAYDVGSGLLVWNFDPGNPQATEPLPSGDTYVRSTPNSWTIATADEALGLVYIPTGNQTPDQWGVPRTAEAERFTDTLVALDLNTGQVRWEFQTVHHDLWDRDLPSQPTLVDIDGPQGKIPAIIQPTKRGDLYVLDRRTGEPIVPVEEVPVPQGTVEGDHTAPTQPVSALSYAPDEPLYEKDMWGGTPLDQMMCRIQFRQLRYEGDFTPPSEQGSLIYPGNVGTFNWPSVAVDPSRQLLFGAPNYLAFVSQLVKRSEVDPDERRGGGETGLQPNLGAPYMVRLEPLLSVLGLPCQAPPWGFVTAVDLRSMKPVWMHKNGTSRDSAPLGIPLPVGTPALGGPIVTAGGVAFMSGTLDYYLRAYDMQNGKELWKGRLPAGGQATPMTYVSEKTGKQYVVQMAGGHGSFGTRIGDSVVAWTLEEE
ncbi:membrane-bound PQQ-dependent dehydrogenase, glucose/quinate/shikimate family [Stutzerimonas nitrititolerans]|uniref:membrane-bound PQQ-dependent dehydrogenase, glucose/quinate/shikimate family n=1 Tax=Stutzerimonas nitrititolerans TaxID=2482751 RepID=UPI001BDC80AD|nr:membrane-bound PQQ-dependent dehydrogenase, glucose/quinate/shikimate family [Stutzerimonas nitrititolerans]MBT1121955.1 membrane-bound PQQ-dependent dehydrogenase, glucose/quinate/shikimate family [Stutzerimonas nitrititolerans]